MNFIKFYCFEKLKFFFQIILHFFTQLIFNNSTSKIKVLLGGITGGYPYSP